METVAELQIPVNPDFVRINSEVEGTPPGEGPPTRTYPNLDTRPPVDKKDPEAYW